MAYYDKISAGYTELHRDEQLRKAAIVKSFIPKSAKMVLDVGCGPSFADWGGRTVGIDISFGLLSRSKAIRVQGKAEHLPFKNQVFDAVVSITAIQNFSKIRQAVREISRVSRDFVAITYLKKSKKATLIERCIREFFLIEKKIIEDKDIIIVAKKL